MSRRLPATFHCTRLRGCRCWLRPGSVLGGFTTPGRASVLPCSAPAAATSGGRDIATRLRRLSPRRDPPPSRRYNLFLLICARHPSARHCPPPDIDLVWCAHLTMPRRYKADTEGLLGEHLTRDSGRRGQLPLASLQTTAERLFAAAGARFFQPGAMFRGTPARCSASRAPDGRPGAPSPLSPPACVTARAGWHRQSSSPADRSPPCSATADSHAGAPGMLYRCVAAPSVLPSACASAHPVTLHGGRTSLPVTGWVRHSGSTGVVNVPPLRCATAYTYACMQRHLHQQRR